MAKDRVEILDHKRIQRIIDRIANQIYENYYNQDEIVMVGIHDQGFKLAERLVDKLKSIAKQNVSIYQLKFDKNDPSAAEFHFSGDPSDLEGKHIVLVDDVLNSGKTIAHALQFLLHSNIGQLFSTVLIDRFHRKYPVRADFVGMTLSTTIQEHITVELNGKSDTAYID